MSLTGALRRLRTWAAALAAAALGSVALAAPDAPRGADGLLAVPPLARVVDLSGVLAPGDRAALDGKLAQFEAAHGSQVAIVIVPSTKPEPIEDFAHRIGDSWKIGRPGVGDGLLIVVATDDRTARIDVARRLEGAIPDATARRVIREDMAPHFAAKDYAGGLSAALDAVFGLIQGEGLPAPPPAPGGATAPAGDTGDDLFGALIPFVIGGIVIGSLLRRLFGFPGALVAGGGAGVVCGVMLGSLAFGAVTALAVVFIAGIFGPFMGVAQVLGGRAGSLPGGGFGGGFGGGGGGFRSGGGGDFSGGGASGTW